MTRPLVGAQGWRFETKLKFSWSRRNDAAMAPHSRTSHCIHIVIFFNPASRSSMFYRCATTSNTQYHCGHLRGVNFNGCKDYPFTRMNHCNSFEDRISVDHVDEIYEYSIFRRDAITWLNGGLVNHMRAYHRPDRGAVKMGHLFVFTSVQMFPPSWRKSRHNRLWHYNSWQDNMCIIISCSRNAQRCL